MSRPFNLIWIMPAEGRFFSAVSPSRRFFYCILPPAILFILTFSRDSMKFFLTIALLLFTSITLPEEGAAEQVGGHLISGPVSQYVRVKVNRKSVEIY